MSCSNLGVTVLALQGGSCYPVGVLRERVGGDIHSSFCLKLNDQVSLL